MIQAFCLVKEVNGKLSHKKMLGRGKLKILPGFIEGLFRSVCTVQKEVTC